MGSERSRRFYVQAVTVRHLPARLVPSRTRDTGRVVLPRAGALASESVRRGLDSLTLVEVPVTSPEGVSLPKSILKSITDQFSLGSVER